MGCARDHEAENDKYRGGLGVAVATRTKYGTVCLRFGVVRKAFVKKGMNDEDMKLRLKMMDDSKEAIWKPLKLSNWLDKYWYEWIMTE